MDACLTVYNEKQSIKKHSKQRDNIILEAKSTAPNWLPVVLLISYDDFTKYRLAWGKYGELYAVLLNIERQLLSRPDNIFCLGLIFGEDDYWKVITLWSKVDYRSQDVRVGIEWLHTSLRCHWLTHVPGESISYYHHPLFDSPLVLQF